MGAVLRFKGSKSFYINIICITLLFFNLILVPLFYENMFGRKYSSQ